jgi:predicted nucleic acid-binding protein
LWRAAPPRAAHRRPRDPADDIDTHVVLYLLHADTAKAARAEDLQDGQVIDGQLTIRNPFAASPPRA